MRFYLLQIPYMARVPDLRQGMQGASRENFSTMLGAMTDQVKLAEELGFSGVCWTEQHLQIEGIEVNTNPILYGAHMAANTTAMRVGQLGIPLPCHNPLKVAEDLALLDHMAGGRTFVGFSRGNTRRWADVFSQHLGIRAASSDKSEQDELNRELLKECFQIIEAAWTEDLFSYDGRFWKVPQEGIPWRWPPTLDAGHSLGEGGVLQQIGVVPKPLQVPHPQIYTPFAFSMTTARFWAAHGVTLVSFVPDEAFLHTTLKVYREHALAAGHEVTNARALAVGGHLLVQRNRDRSERFTEEFSDLFNYAYNVDPYHVPLGRVFGGTGEDALAHIEHLRDELDIEEVFLWHHVNCFEPDQEREALEEFGTKVVACLRD